MSFRPDPVLGPAVSAFPWMDLGGAVGAGPPRPCADAHADRRLTRRPGDLAGNRPSAHGDSPAGSGDDPGTGPGQALTAALLPGAIVGGAPARGGW